MPVSRGGQKIPAGHRCGPHQCAATSSTMRALNACDVTVDVAIRSVRASGTIRDPMLFNHPLSSLMTMPQSARSRNVLQGDRSVKSQSRRHVRLGALYCSRTTVLLLTVAVASSPTNGCPGAGAVIRAGATALDSRRSSVVPSLMKSMKTRLLSLHR